MKKLLKLIKFLITGSAWSAVCLKLSEFVLHKWWNFDPFQARQWSVLKNYWNSDGVISSTADYMFFVVLLIFPILWIWGLKYFYKVNYVRLLLAPFKYFDERQLRKYTEKDAHVVIKNIAIGEKITVDDVINQRIKKEGTRETLKVSSDMREQFSKKISERKDK